MRHSITTMAQCASCRIPASLRCAGCRDAPEYEPGDAINIAYCSAECQSSDWEVHKSRCATLRKRRKLFRAATILKAALLTYREAFFDIPLAKIELRNGVLYLYRHPSSDISPRPFPRDLTANVAHKEAALTHYQCTLALALLGPLARKLLAGVASSTENIDLRIGKPLVPTKLVELVPGADFGEAPHTVLKICLRSSRETWIVDTAGCQYGFRDVLNPFDRYLTGKACAVLGQPTSYTASETTDLDFIESFLPLPMNIGMGNMRDFRDRQRKGRLHFAAFIDQRVGSGKDSFNPSKDLDGSAPGFQRKFEKFTTELKTHMDGLDT
ncbi:hypothetical protein C8R44DRAFT_645100 [Mycena epipterygia]|nr:hypothetical protein C8R44DRAFT_645100 [Mycena epipterygia]